MSNVRPLSQAKLASIKAMPVLRIVERVEAPRPSLASIRAATCSIFDLTLSELRSKTKVPRICWPRQVAMHVSRELTDKSMSQIAIAFGLGDHTTVMFADRKIKDLIAEGDGDAIEAVQALTRRVMMRVFYTLKKEGMN
jgi:chromosomal replication initiator protein